MMTKAVSEPFVAFIGLWFLTGGFCMRAAYGLRCYTDIEATQITRCKESEGFRTCFTKYNDSKGFEGLEGHHQVTGRGCSTKDKVFYKECETHSYGDQVEKMCFCSYFLCNSANSPHTPRFSLIFGATILAFLLNHCCHSRTLACPCDNTKTSLIIGSAESQRSSRETFQPAVS